MKTKLEYYLEALKDAKDWIEIYQTMHDMTFCDPKWELSEETCQRLLNTRDYAKRSIEVKKVEVEKWNDFLCGSVDDDRELYQWWQVYMPVKYRTVEPNGKLIGDRFYGE